jgi:lipopolysaccharide transport system ATP-binding protein
MSNIVLKAENISKQYRLGQLGTGTISHDLNRAWAKLRGKEDPYLKVGDANDRSKAGGSDYVWSLKDINFEVKQGEVLGIIGKNGAGKSTLLKILSQVTTPTTGRVKVKGRIAALLEVGTGFHPDLTGRENVFLNGAILGMSKREITSKLDEIVDFSGVAKYLDTPVKRYSSGMMVRLGFAVAAHLEPEILIVDEVLAVGDAEFQKKCLGKMKDVSGQGRTVLFVSHHMPSIKTLCTRGLYLERGTIMFQGGIDKTIFKYFERAAIGTKGIIPESFERYNTGQAKIIEVGIVDVSKQPVDEVFYSDPLIVKIKLTVFEIIEDAIIDFKILSKDGIEIIHTLNAVEKKDAYMLNRGEHEYFVQIENYLQPDFYNLTVGLHYSSGATIDFLEHIYDFEILSVGRDNLVATPWKYGFLKLNGNWIKT